MNCNPSTQLPAHKLSSRCQRAVAQCVPHTACRMPDGPWLSMACDMRHVALSGIVCFNCFLLACLLLTNVYLIYAAAFALTKIASVLVNVESDTAMATPTPTPTLILTLLQPPLRAKPMPRRLETEYLDSLWNLKLQNFALLQIFSLAP